MVQISGRAISAGPVSEATVPLPKAVLTYSEKPKPTRFDWGPAPSENPGLITFPPTPYVPSERMSERERELRNDKIEKLYLQGKSRKKIAAMTEVSYSTVNAVLRDRGHQLKASPSTPHENVKVCGYCENEFVRTNERTDSWNRKKYCSKSHAVKATRKRVDETPRTCPCGKPVVRREGERSTRWTVRWWCSKECHQEYSRDLHGL